MPVPETVTAVVPNVSVNTPEPLTVIWFPLLSVAFAVPVVVFCGTGLMTWPVGDVSEATPLVMLNSKRQPEPSVVVAFSSVSEPPQSTSSIADPMKPCEVPKLS